MPFNNAQIIVFNGPPRAGKSTCARELSIALGMYGYRTHIESLAGPMKHFLAVCLGQQYDTIEKDLFNPTLDCTPRDFLIRLSETFIKPNFGHDFYGRCLKWRAETNLFQCHFILVDDNGFEEELAPLSQPYIIRVHRPGHDFLGDSRTWIPNYSVELSNSGSKTQLASSIKAIAASIAKNRWVWYNDSNKWINSIEV